MASDQSAKLALPYLAAAQAQKHVTHNEALRRLDAYVQLVLDSISATEPPTAPVEGACWFVPEGGSGSFAGKEGTIATYEAGAYDFLPVPAGTRAFIRETWRMALFDGEAWVSPLAGTANRAAIEASVLEEDVVLSGAFTETGIAIPARAIVLGVSTRTLATVTGASSYDCGISGETSKFGGALGISRGATNSGVVGPTAFYAPTPVRLTANGGAFTGGRVRVAIHYLLCPAAQARAEEAQWWRGSPYLLDETAPTLAADFVRELYALSDAECSSPDIFSRSGGSKQVTAADGTVVIAAGSAPAFDYASGRRRMVLEGSATNLFVGSAAPSAAQSITTSAQVYTLSFWGPGTITLSGAFSATVAGSATGARTSYTFTSTAAALTLTPSGTVTEVQLEAGSVATSYIETTSAAATRVTDVSPWASAAAGLVSTGSPCTIVFRGSVAQRGGAVFIGVNDTDLMRRGSGDPTLIAFTTPVGMLTHGNAAISGMTPFGNAIGWDAAGSLRSTNGSLVVNNATAPSGTISSMWFGLPAGLSSGLRIEIDEILVWPAKGSAGAIQSQARAWA